MEYLDASIKGIRTDNMKLLLNGKDISNQKNKTMEEVGFAPKGTKVFVIAIDGDDW